MAKIAETVHFTDTVDASICHAAIITRLRTGSLVNVTVFRADNFQQVSGVSGLPYDVSRAPGTWHNLADHI